MAAFEITPDQASRGDLLPDRELSMLGAQWLAAGYDSLALRRLASLGPGAAELNDARALFEKALVELGYPRQTGAWRGYWPFIDWARSQVGRTHTPYAAAQRVLEVIGDVPELWDPGRGQELTTLLSNWDANAAERRAVDDEIRAYLRSLRAEDCPPA